MSAANISMVLRGAELFNRSDVDGMMELWHPTAEYADNEPFPRIDMPPPSRGPTGERHPTKATGFHYVTTPQPD